MVIIKTVFIISLALLLGACSVTSEHDDGPPQEDVDIASIPDAVPRIEPLSRYGNDDTYVVMGKKYHVMRDSRGFMERGIASWYGKKFHGRRTSSGETYNMYAMTAAHKTLPLPTYVRVTNLRNGRSVLLKVNDRGPFHENRVIDLSYTAAAKLDILSTGTGLVEIRAMDATRYAKEDVPVRPAPAPVSNPDDFYIQVGTFGILTNAEQLRSKLVVLGENLVKISQVLIDGRTLYRVRIGPLTDIDMADSIVMKLDQFGVQEHRIVVD